MGLSLRWALVLGIAARTDVVRAQAIGDITPFSIFDRAPGVVSPDGRTIAHRLADTHGTRLWLLDVATGRRRLLTPRPGERNDIAWSADGRAIAYVGGVYLADAGTSVTGLWVVDVETGHEQLAYNDGRDAWIEAPRWTADGRIAFTVLRIYAVPGNDGGRADGREQSGTERHVWTVNANGSDARMMPDTVSTDEGRVFAPDSTRLAYLAKGCPKGSGTESGLWIARRRDQPQCVAIVPSSSRVVAWSSDGSTLYVLSPPRADGDAHSIAAYAIDIPDDTGEAKFRRIDPDSGDVRALSVTADGRVVLAIYRARARLALVPSSGGTPAAVNLDTPLSAAFPLWSADGGALAYQEDQWPPGSHPERRQLVVSVAADGRPSGPSRAPDAQGDFTNDRSIGRDSSWYITVSPSGDCVAWTVPRGRPLDKAITLSAAPTTTWPRFTRSAAGYGAIGVPGINPGNQVGVQWSADGRRLLITTNVGRLFLRDVDPSSCTFRGGAAPLKLGGDPVTALAARLSPDGAQIAFIGKSVDPDGGSGLFTVPASGAPVRQLAAFAVDGGLGGPEWSPDGAWLYFARPDSTNHSSIERIAVPPSGSRQSATPAVLARISGSLVQPALSPDGRTLAVTEWQGGTLLWTVPEEPVRHKERQTPPAVDLTHHAISSSVVDPALLDLAHRIVAATPAVMRLWPAFWSRRMPFFLIAPDHHETILVARDCAFPGFDSVTGPGVPANLVGHVFRSENGWTPDIEDDLGLGVPGLNVSAGVRDSIDREAVRERALREFFVRAFGLQQFGLAFAWRPVIRYADYPGFSFAHGYGCPYNDLASCLAAERLERLALLRAFDADDRALPRRLARYLSVRWLNEASTLSRRGGGGAERFAGITAMVGERAALLAAGGRAASYITDVRRRLGDTLRVEHAPLEAHPRIQVTGEAIAILLDRLGVNWRESVRDTLTLEGAVAKAVHFDSTTALTMAGQVMREEDFPALVAQARRELGGVPATTPGQPDETYYLNAYLVRALYALDERSDPLKVDMRVRAGDSSAISIDADGGTAGTLTPGPGYLIVPRAKRVVVRTKDVELTVTGLPVSIDARPQNAPGRKRIVIFVPDSVAAAVRASGRATTFDRGGLRVRTSGNLSVLAIFTGGLLR